MLYYSSYPNCLPLLGRKKITVIVLLGKPLRMASPGKIVQFHVQKPKSYTYILYMCIYIYICIIIVIISIIIWLPQTY